MLSVARLFPISHNSMKYSNIIRVSFFVFHCSIKCILYVIFTPYFVFVLFLDHIYFLFHFVLISLFPFVLCI
jgi:hypothetical protein